MAQISQEILDALHLTQPKFDSLTPEQQGKIRQIEQAIGALSGTDKQTTLSQLSDKTKDSVTIPGGLTGVGATVSSTDYASLLGGIQEAMAPDVSRPSNDTLKALRLTPDQWAKLSRTEKGQIQQIDQYIGTLPTENMKNAYSQLSKNIDDFHSPNAATFMSTALGFYPNTRVDYGSLLGGLQGPPATQAQQQAAAAAKQQVTAQQEVAQYGQEAVPYGQIQINGEPTQQHWQAMSQMMGFDAQQAYSDYQNSFAQAQRLANDPRNNDPLAAQSFTAAGTPAQPQSAADWFNQQQTQIQGQFQPLLQTMDAAYQLQTGAPMPVELEAQVLDQINKMTPDARNSLLASMPTMKTSIARYGASDPTAAQHIAALLPQLGTGAADPLITTFNAAIAERKTVAALPQQLEIQNVSTFMNQTGQAPTDQQKSEMSGLDTYGLQRYIDNQPSRVAGMTWGTYTAATKNMSKLWTENFGKDPTDQELQKFAGWNAADINRWVDSQPSKDNPSMTIGKRNGYLAMADQASQKWFGTSADSQMIDALDKHFSSQGDKAP